MKAAFLLLLGAASALVVPPLIQNNGRDRAMRIVGGHEVTDRTEFPFFVRIVMDDPIGHMYCGGTLLSNQHVLTAAQCTYHHSYFYLGFGTIIFSIPATTVGTSRKMEHHLYSPVDWNYDIALITMDYTESNEFIQPAQLPRRFQDGDYWNYGMVRIAGFGSTSETGSRPDYLHATTLQVIPNEECEEVYGSVVESWHICCHGFEEQGSSPCYGDAGGAIMVGDVTVGVTAFISSRGCTSGDPSGYTRTTPFLDWISDHTGIVIPEDLSP